ncbi:hypothetical protein PF005_g26890 [Phytophthora fragariae]|uniref:Uncharacterized protein n=2 Tax=Phytophthora TaxID=4783 RepID=A0A6A3QU53_9STRA|nr:hypothetical protein PF003_g25439 [Phytophthora fragariae]KAE8990208.1 hypothetical protein PR002_g21215 [Phytophthora rubi]KAE9083282.1 hypothetical protein PF006_g26719 [Phytophthora fragariae]KAE9172048.1 hypothetical protein PF005_g26890 [Phytophthora fragariae]KAE9173801.1 hypothetical protein PF004_g26853 [Phytophthora fragariae]
MSWPLSMTLGSKVSPTCALPACVGCSSLDALVRCPLQASDASLAPMASLVLGNGAPWVLVS